MSTGAAVLPRAREKAGRMSVQAIKWAIRQRTDGVATKAALLVVAEAADTVGVCRRTTVPILAEAACTDERTMRRLLNRLQSDSLLTIVQYRGRTSEYVLAMAGQGSHPGVGQGPDPGQGQGSHPGVGQGSHPEGGDTPARQGPDPGHPGVTPPPDRGHTPPSQNYAAPSEQPRGRAEAPAHTREGRPARQEHPSPAQLNATASSVAGFRLVSQWAQRNPSVLSSRRRELAKAVDGLLAEGADPALIPAALDSAHDGRWKNPLGALRHAYDDVRRGSKTAAVNGRHWEQ